MKHITTIFIAVFILGCNQLTAQQSEHSVAREWNEALLHSIRKDFARPTVHARNLWHISVAMYDAWAVYTDAADCYFLGDTVGQYICSFDGISLTSNRKASQEEAISYAAFRLIKHRFNNSPNKEETFNYVDSLFIQLGYDSNKTSIDYSGNDPATLGNYIAHQLILFGLQDSANEQGQYENQYYEPVNESLVMASPGNPDISDPNRWQPLSLDVYIDQSGNIIPGGTADCLSPEWGEVTPFSLKNEDLNVYFRDGHPYKVYHDPGPPSLIDTANGGIDTDLFKWNFTMVAKWAGHLDTADGVLWDISPASIGNIPWYPSTLDSLEYFYDYENGGDNSIGHALNPVTGQPYSAQIVHRADYARVLAEFWADGPDSETPPGHWFTLLNYVSDHPEQNTKWMGIGPVRDRLEWDIKTYFSMGGTMHDVAISCWGIKGWYDFVRPVSAFRYMADQGQSSDTNLANYSPNGLELQTGFIEMVDSADPIAGMAFQNVGKVKVKTWMGPDFVLDPAVDMAGVDWILAENWWSFQRPSFVAPPFPGFMSGHSTYSRAGAELMSTMTGSEFFPGGMGEFLAKKNEFLFFEEGPSQDIILQWATYRDASDQCSLSRIWGGIHPPMDDIPGRKIGVDIYEDAFALANSYWEDQVTDLINVGVNYSVLNESSIGNDTFRIVCTYDKPMNTSVSPTVSFPNENPIGTFLQSITASSSWEDDYTYISSYEVLSAFSEMELIDIAVSGADDPNGNTPTSQVYQDMFSIDMMPPTVTNIATNLDSVRRINQGGSTFDITVDFSEQMDQSVSPTIELPITAAISLTQNQVSSDWMSNSSYTASYDVSDSANQVASVDVKVFGGMDASKNDQLEYLEFEVFGINVQPPLGIQTVAKNGYFQVYPNPIYDGSELVIESERMITGIRMLDITGKVVFEVYGAFDSKYQINALDLSAGEYLMEVTNSLRQTQSKIVIVAE